MVSVYSTITPPCERMKYVVDPESAMNAVPKFAGVTTVSRRSS